MANSSVLKEFGEYWRERVDSGQSSGFDRMEEMAIKIFHDWLLREYKLEKKIVPITREQLENSTTDLVHLIATEFEPNLDQREGN